ncbi:hypothetical protein Ddye_027206 [Dipteronia dyeriana]|uniref:Uncharacterized protein n=1 Tax=Dipteronia dyeriana TaxID=168575 RepID=A0AAD9TPB4_9ROSI|nr:hypothetical protein Ddye_027206 [Dipteronia dyeriana]
MGIVFREFLGDASQFYKQTRQEFFEMRCCSLDKNDIDYHYRRMSFMYHTLGGINDETLRHVYLNSLTTELQEELQRLIELSGRGLRDITLGEIHMFTHTALDKLCATQRFFTKMIREGRKYDREDEKDVCFNIIDVKKEIEERDLDTSLVQSFVVERSILFVANIGGPNELGMWAVPVGLVEDPSAAYLGGRF